MDTSVDLNIEECHYSFGSNGRMLINEEINMADCWSVCYRCVLDHPLALTKNDPAAFILRIRAIINSGCCLWQSYGSQETAPFCAVFSGMDPER